MEPVSVILATKRHVTALGSTMHPGCRAEVWAAIRATPAKAVRYSLNRSARAWAVYVSGDLIAVGGIVLGSDGWVTPWALTSVAVDRHRRAFWLAVQSAVAEMRRQRYKLVQMIHYKQTATLRMAAHLGFTISEAVPWGASREPFHQIVLGASDG